jgi:hypothetical protein
MTLLSVVLVYRFQGASFWRFQLDSQAAQTLVQLAFGVWCPASKQKAVQKAVGVFHV